LLCASLLLALAACGKKGEEKSAASHPLPEPPRISQSQPGKPGGRLTLFISSHPRTFNPLFAFDTSSDEVVRMLFGSLVNIDFATQTPEPGMAESWSVAEDQKTWTFKLRKGLHWSDGQPLSADDVVFTWNEIMFNPDYNKLTYDLFRIGGKAFNVAKVDELTVRVVTPDVFAPFLEYFGGIAILPKHVLSDAVTKKQFPSAYASTTRPDKIVGSGPYRLKQVQPGKSVLLERNPEYWSADQARRRLPYLDEVMFVVSGNPSAVPILFLNGTGSAYEAVRPESYEQFKQLSTNGHFQVLELGVGTERDFFWFNQNTGTNRFGKPIVNPAKLKWFRNKKFRQAVACAINRERMVREVYAGRGEPSYGFISSENRKWNNPNIPRYAYDPARARALLAEIGIQDRNNDGILEDEGGTPLEITFHSNLGNAPREKCAGLIVEDLAKIGIKLAYQPVEFKTLVDRINGTFDYESILMGLGGGGVDPASQMNVLKSGEALHQWFPEQKAPGTDWEARLDWLMDAQMRTLDFNQRKKYFDEVQTILAEELPMIYTVAPFAYAAVRSNVGNVRPSVLTPYRVTWNVEELYLK
jgi:peptide/nickel transport system substrate-binding protein